YLYQIAIRIQIDQARCENIPRTQTSDYSPELEVQLQAKLDWSYLLNQLFEKECNLLWLAYAEEFSHEEISKIMGLQRSSIKVLLYRIKSKLKHYLE
ncbi:MAG TPA: sigma factor-like helix-turn-helix DNA-binding protein, partial [Saprospiraceae bacterium]|nr:sigma factor-like helix-turn-helix DNA-binding protein [Saprospiraceae bacterium]